MKAITVLEGASCAHELPAFLRDIRDFEELMRASDVLAAHLKQLLRRVLNNAHIETAEADCLTGWEQGLGIIPESAELEPRRAAIVERLSNVTVFNEDYIMGLIDELFGAVEYRASMDTTTLTLTIETQGEAVDGPEGEQTYAQTVEAAIRPIVPMNVRIDNIMRAELGVPVFVGSISLASLHASIQVSS